MAKSKRLKLIPDIIESQDSLYNKETKITFEDGMYTTILPLFRPSIIESCVEDLANFLAEYEKHGAKIDDKNFFKFLYLFIVQHFSTLVPELPTDFPTRLNLLNKLANNKYVIALEEHFDPKQIEFVYEIIFKKLDALQKMMQQNHELRRQMIDKVDGMNLENKEIIKQIYFGEGEQDALVQ